MKHATLNSIIEVSSVNNDTSERAISIQTTVIASEGLLVSSVMTLPLPDAERVYFAIGAWLDDQKGEKKDAHNSDDRAWEELREEDPQKP